MSPEQLLDGDLAAQGVLAEVRGFYADIPIVWSQGNDPRSQYQLTTLAPPRGRIVVAPSQRAKSALIHELLHLALRCRAFPTPTPPVLQDGLAGPTIHREWKAMQNEVDHEAFLDVYLGLGRPRSEFLYGLEFGPSVAFLQGPVPAGVTEYQLLVLHKSIFARAWLAGQHLNADPGEVLDVAAAGFDDRVLFEEALAEWRGGELAKHAATYGAASDGLSLIIGLPVAAAWTVLHAA